VRVSHRLEPLESGRLRITHSAAVDGPAKQARELGPLITADFPDTMRALVALANGAIAIAEHGPITRFGAPEQSPGFLLLARHPGLAAHDPHRT
jgi:hypothetical protein